MENGAHKPHQISSNFDNTVHGNTHAAYSAQRRTRTGGAVAVHTGSTGSTLSRVRNTPRRRRGDRLSPRVGVVHMGRGVGGVWAHPGRGHVRDRHRDLGRDRPRSAGGVLAESALVLFDDAQRLLLLNAFDRARLRPGLHGSPAAGVAPRHYTPRTMHGRVYRTRGHTLLRWVTP